MNTIESLVIEVDDLASARDFYDRAFGPDLPITLRESDAPTSGFRGFTVSLISAQPADADALFEAAVAAGATVIKPTAKSFWGYGGVVQAPDGTIWNLPTSRKKNTGPARREYESVVLLLGVDDVAETKRTCVERGFEVARSFGRKYVEFEAGGSAVTLALQSRKAVAKNSGVPAEGAGSHRLAVATTGDPVTDADGYAWERAGDQPRRAPRQS